jgi:hypothetical protein
VEGSSVDNEICLLSASSGWMDFLEFLESGMTGSGVGTQPTLPLVPGALRMPPVYQPSCNSLVSRVASSARAYLLVMENICFDVLGFFMASFRIREEFISPLLKNIMIDLSSTSRITFLLLQNCWMYSRKDSFLLNNVG